MQQIDRTTTAITHSDNTSRRKITIQGSSCDTKSPFQTITCPTTKSSHLFFTRAFLRLNILLQKPKLHTIIHLTLSSSPSPLKVHLILPPNVFTTLGVHKSIANDFPHSCLKMNSESPCPLSLYQPALLAMYSPLINTPASVFECIISAIICSTFTRQNTVMTSVCSSIF